MSAETVKIVRFHQTGGPEVLQLDELPLPEPGLGEVRLRVKAIGLNRAEVMFRMGRYLVAPELPSKLGYEASGIVEAVGGGSTPRGSERPPAPFPLSRQTPTASTVRLRSFLPPHSPSTRPSSRMKRALLSGCST